MSVGDRVIGIGAKVEPSTIRGQGCLAAVTPDTVSWIIVETLNAAAVGAGTAFPIGVSLDHLMELYWRWRDVEIRYDMTYVIAPGTNDEQTNLSIDQQAGDFGRRVYPPSGQQNVTREAQLILPAQWYELSMDGSNTNGSFTLFGEDASDPDAPRVLFYNDLYWPELYVRIVDHDYSGGIYGSGTVQTFPHDTPGIEEACSGSVTMSDGTVYTLPLYGNDSSNEIRLSASAYWPHQKKDGTAKYDAVSGVRL